MSPAPRFSPLHFETEGPFGLPMLDQQARALEDRLKHVPREPTLELRRCSLGRGVVETQPGERGDVSWITEESPDRLGDIVLVEGMDDSHFRLNPIVTLNHCYEEPPVGRSLWRRKTRDGSRRGVKAKTVYPRRPTDWVGEVWPPDLAFQLLQAGLLSGKSIGFLPLKVRAPSADDLAQHPTWEGARCIIEEWLLAEYACCYFPMQPHAVVEEVLKAVPTTWVKTLGLPASTLLPHTPWSEVERAAQRLATGPMLQARLESVARQVVALARGAV